jgi:hypothetical protein
VAGKGSRINTKKSETAAAKKEQKATSAIRGENKEAASKPKLTPEERRAKAIANLNPFKPGQSGNPSGRPKTKPITDALFQILHEKVPEDKEGRTYLRLMVRAIAREAVKGKTQAFSEIVDRVEGKAPQTMSLTGEGGEGPVAFLDLTPEQNDAKLLELLRKAGAAKKEQS